ncbi:nuclear transcription factor Y subunit B-8-like [Triticum dicoccoides]|uniref:nuclear transcription factor Y subunit B-8-like n=1 Tax=Triticum dicoccoides TaxID=85692 RepID=UPI00162DE3EA|nr:nuclear transcription factor Y subunit B-8-like [Triticum dicoccoides]
MENADVPNGAAAPAPTQATPVVREQDRLMPIANVIRIMRRALPAHAKISDDAKEAIQECVSEFISFVTGEANERCHMEHRKTVNAEDIVWALNRLGFDDYVVPLSVFLHRMRDPEAATGAAAAGDRRAVTSAPPRAAPPVLHAMPLQAQMQQPMYAPTARVQVQNQMQRPVYASPAPMQVQNQVRRPMYAPPAPVQVQMQRGVYAPRAPVQGYAVGITSVRANVGGQCQVFGGESVVAQQYYGYGYGYGQGAYGAGSSNVAACADEESSSNGVTVPGEGTGEPEPTPAAEESQDKPVQSG